MNQAKIWHNPRCSKSRQTLSLLEEKNIDVTIVDYLKETPSEKEILNALNMLALPIDQMVRTKEKVFKELALDVNENSKEKWAKVLHQNPILIERPVVFYNNKAAIGRPPENVKNLF